MTKISPEFQGILKYLNLTSDPKAPEWRGRVVSTSSFAFNEIKRAPEILKPRMETHQSTFFNPDDCGIFEHLCNVRFGSYQRL